MHALKPPPPLGPEESTSAYYELNAQAYFDATLHVDMSDLYDQFLHYIPPGGRILDAGSGSGRDTFAFLQKGYEVHSFDSSPALAELSTRLTGVPTQVIRFQEFESVLRYDGIWACASLLHVPTKELHDALARSLRALKPGGVLYVSVKHGSDERVADDGRIFIDLDKTGMRNLFAKFPDVTLQKIWITGGEGSLRGRDNWINAIALKAGGEQ
jgi:SAM-dependent methyltransferase